MSSELKKRILSFGSVIVVGIVISAFWDFAFRPIFVWIGHRSLTLVNYVHSSYRDTAYSDIALGNHEQASMIFLFLIASTMVFGIVPILTFEVRNRIQRTKKRREDGIKSLSLENAQASLSTLEMGIDKSHRTLKFLTLALIFVSIMFYIPILTMNYVNKSIAHFNNSYAIVMPFLKAEERDKLVSDFAQIEKREDFVALIEFLNQRAVLNGKKLRDHWIW